MSNRRSEPIPTLGFQLDEFKRVLLDAAAELDGIRDRLQPRKQQAQREALTRVSARLQACADLVATVTAEQDPVALGWIAKLARWSGASARGVLVFVAGSIAAGPLGELGLEAVDAIHDLPAIQRVIDYADLIDDYANSFDFGEHDQADAEPPTGPSRRVQRVPLGIVDESNEAQPITVRQGDRVVNSSAFVGVTGSSAVKLEPAQADGVGLVDSVDVADDRPSPQTSGS